MTRSRNIAVILVLIGSTAGVGAYLLLSQQERAAPRPDARPRPRDARPAERAQETVAELRALLSHPSWAASAPPRYRSSSL